MEKYRIVSNDLSKREKRSLEFIGKDVGDTVHKFHSSFPQYTKTPLVELKKLAELLGVENIFVKDESYRFALNAFKVLGGSYAIGKYIAKLLGLDINDLSYEKLISKAVKEELGELTFITATDGNHGRGVAWTANELKQKSIVLMPKGSSKERLENIRACGADAEIKDMNYDECVRCANQLAEDNSYVMVQDTAWEGYEDIPTWIMQGYITMAHEIYEDLNKKKTIPTHIFLQAGVGSMAAAMTGFFASVYEDKKPIIVIVEPEKADCLYRTAKADDGKLHFVTGDMNTIMAGLACGEPCTIGWEVLESYVDFFLSIPEEASAHGMRVLANPLNGDSRVISGESGAATTGAFAQILEKKDLAHIKDMIGLNDRSIILLISTEGDTDKLSYRDIVWNGKYPNL